MPDRAHAVTSRIVDVAGRILREQGPAALSARKLAAQAGTSTMVVYTHFGSMSGVVEAVAAEGFSRLAAAMAEVAETDDALTDLAELARAYLSNARANPNLYVVMFGAVSVGGATPGDRADEVEDDGVAAGTFTTLVAAVDRAQQAGAIAPGDPETLAAQFWTALHGYVMLELAGLHTAASEDDVLWPILTKLALPGA